MPMRVSRPHKQRFRVVGRHNLRKTAHGWISRGVRFRKRGGKWCAFTGYAKSPTVCRKTLKAAVHAAL